MCSQDYIDRLTYAGMRIDNAWMIVDDFLRDLDFGGLEDYCKALEARHVAED